MKSSGISARYWAGDAVNLELWFSLRNFRLFIVLIKQTDR